MNRRTRSNPAFTLIEILVAIGIVALVAVGIAQIFAAVGETVSRGRQLGRFNQIAAQIERQMREDFNAMTRDGFLVIRQQFADRDMDGVINADPGQAQFDGVETSPDDAQPRLRRIDEILFFRRGDFVSAREPVHPDLLARSSEAMVYYGHGRRAYDTDPNEPTTEFRRPEVALENNSTLRDPDFALGAVPTSTSSENPNRYASDWTLLRKVILLIEPPAAAVGDQELEMLLRLSDGVLADSDIQIGGQPAVTWPFRDIAGRLTSFESGDGHLRDDGMGFDTTEFPSLQSGLVDIATTSIATIRRIVLDITNPPSAFYNLAGEPPEDESDLSPTGSGSGQFMGGDENYMRAWMENALPANSLPGFGERLRYEPEPPDYFGVMVDGRYEAPPAPSNLAREVRRADQLALGSSNFVTRCTEFIIEWSFGQVDARGNLLWWGSPLDTDSDDQPDGMTTYPLLPPFGVGLAPFRPYEDVQPPRQLTNYQVRSDLIYGPVAPNLTSARTATFGYVDPTSTPDDTVVPWAWPRLVRVTMTIADDIDPTVEQTFQFVFELPETPDP